MTALLIRVVIYTVVMFLIMIVYTGQYHDDVKTILSDSVKKTGKFVAWTGVLVLVMEICFWGCVD